jgi:hypothetical protein
MRPGGGRPGPARARGLSPSPRQLPSSCTCPGQELGGMTDEPNAPELRGRLDFVAQENKLHTELAALTGDLVAARQHGLSGAQWTTALSSLIDICAAVFVFRRQLQEFVRADDGPGASARLR